MLNFYKNVFYVFHLLMISFLVFQFPVLMGVLLYLNILKRAPLYVLGRYITIGIFVVSALITPPDIVTQVSIALPLTVLYFLVLLIAKIFNWGQEDG